MSPMDKEQYDQASTIFSPDGRMYQVEYAREAIRRGGLAMGIRFQEGILFGIDKSIYNSLIEEDDLEKFYRITPTVGTAASGLVADTRVLVDLLRDKAQEEKRRYGEEPDLKTLISWLSKINEIYTRYEGVRPFGTALIFGGRDEYGYHLYETDPSGIFQERTATAIGRGASEGLAILEEKHSLDISRKEAVELALEVLKATFERIDEERNLGMELHILSGKGYEKIDLTEDQVTGVSDLPGEVPGKKVGRSTEKGPRKKPKARPGDKVEKSRNGEGLRELLDTVFGLNESVKRSIVDRFETLEAIKKAKPDDLMEINGVGRVTAERIIKAAGKMK